MGNLLKKVIRRNFGLYSFAKKICTKFRPMGGAKIDFHGWGRYRKDVIGKDNHIIVGSETLLKDTDIRIRGNNNTIIFGENCSVGPGCSFWMEGNNISITIGRKTTFTRDVHFCVQEDNMSITVGEDCMFSNTIVVRTSDSHPIYDISTMQRINPPKCVTIGNHVWIAPNSKIMKGAAICDGCIVGSNTMVSKLVPANCLVVGMPAKLVKENVKWTREELW